MELRLTHAATRLTSHKNGKPNIVSRPMGSGAASQECLVAIAEHHQRDKQAGIPTVTSQ